MSSELQPIDSGFDPVKWFRGLIQNSPWIVISIMVHVVILAIMGVIMIAQSTKAPEEVVTEVKIAAPRESKEEQMPELPDVIDRNSVPKIVDSDVAQLDVDVFIPINEPVPEKDADVERGDPTKFSDMPSDITNMPAGANASSAIGAGDGPGNRAAGPSAFSGVGGGGGKFGSRFGQGKQKATRSGGSQIPEAVRLALEWLKAHQDEDGRWDTAGFMKHDKEGVPCDGPGNATNDVGITGLALLAFLGDGNTLRQGPYKEVVRKAVKWLGNQQSEDGAFGQAATHEHMYNHSIAALAMCEAYGLSEFPPLKDKAQKGINYIQNARNPYKVWRYYPRDGNNDSSITGWMVLALKSAEDFKLKVDKSAFDYSKAWFDEVTDPSTGQCGYTKRGEGSSRKEGFQDKFPVAKTEAMTAVGLLCRFFLGQDPKTNPVMTAAADTMLKKPPVWNEQDGSIDMYYWYYASFAMFQMGGNHWNQWSKKLVEAVIKPQRQDGNFKGSWNNIDPWGPDGGRVYSTATLCLCLEAYYRYARVLGGR